MTVMIALVVLAAVLELVLSHLIHSGVNKGMDAVFNAFRRKAAEKNPPAQESLAARYAHDLPGQKNGWEERRKQG